MINKKNFCLLFQLLIHLFRSLSFNGKSLVLTFWAISQQWGKFFIPPTALLGNNRISNYFLRKIYGNIKQQWKGKMFRFSEVYYFSFKLYENFWSLKFECKRWLSEPNLRNYIFIHGMSTCIYIVYVPSLGVPQIKFITVY